MGRGRGGERINNIKIWKCTNVYLLHVIPVVDYSMFNWVIQSQDTSLTLSLMSDIGVLLADTIHHTFMTRVAYDGGEDSTGCIVSGKPCLACARAIVYHQLRNFIVVTHSDVSEGKIGYTLTEKP